MKNTPEAPKFAVIFTSERASGTDGYDEAAARMVELVKQQPGFLGFDSARGADGLGITVSYWDSLEAIARWKAIAEHREAQAKGRERWYSRYSVRIVQVQREYTFGEKAGR